ncbi:MAG: hypothetical protein EBZ47_01070 [Chlamydiae bacterium]|nr:hypothetical protein [Chlamydiota bacterium]
MIWSAGIVLNSAASLIEFGIACVVTVNLIALNIISCRKWQAIEIGSYQCASYGIHALSIFFAQMVSFVSSLRCSYHVDLALICSVQAFISTVIGYAGVSSFFYGGFQDQHLQDMLKDELYKVIFLFKSDLEIAFLMDQIPISNAIEIDHPFFKDYPQHALTLRSLVQFFREMGRDNRVQRQEFEHLADFFLRFLKDYAIFMGFISPTTELRVVRNQETRANGGERGVGINYKLKLELYIKESFEMIFTKNELANWLGEGNADLGREHLKFFSSEIYIPLARLAQILEISNKIECPQENFGMFNLSSRRDVLMNLQDKYNALSREQKNYLLRKILDSSFDLSQISDLSEFKKSEMEIIFKILGEAASQLYQGNLLKAFHRNGSVNLLARACQSAMRSLGLG